MLSFSLSLSVLSVLFSDVYAACNSVPAQAQVIDPRSLLVLPDVLPPAEMNGTSVRLPKQEQ